MSLSNYPPGAEYDPHAPWNEPVIPEKDFDVTCCQTLSRTVVVTTDNYCPGAEGCDYEPDGEGGYVSCGYHDDDDTSDTDWEKEYKTNGYHTPLELIQMLKEYVQKDAEKYLEDHKDDCINNPHIVPAEKQWKYKELLELIRECDDWTEDETVFIEE